MSSLLFSHIEAKLDEAESRLFDDETLILSGETLNVFPQIPEGRIPLGYDNMENLT